MKKIKALYIVGAVCFMVAMFFVGLLTGDRIGRRANPYLKSDYARRWEQADRQINDYTRTRISQIRETTNAFILLSNKLTCTDLFLHLSNSCDRFVLIQGCEITAETTFKQDARGPATNEFPYAAGSVTASHPRLAQ